MYLYVLKDYETAIEIYTQCIEEDPDDFFAYNRRAEAYTHQNKPEQANQDSRTVIQRAAELNSQNHDVFSQLGIAHLSLGEGTQAKAAFEKAEIYVKTDGTFEGTCHCIPWNWAIYHTAESNYDQALVYIDQALAMNNSVRNHMFKAEILKKMN